MTAAPDAVPTPGGSLSEDTIRALDQSLIDSGCHGFVGGHPELYAVVADLLARARAEERERIAVAIEAAKAGCVDRDRMTLDVAAAIARAEGATDA